MKIICILGRSGSGKSAIETGLEKLGYNRIVSYTTREMRGNEENGREYHFVSKESFKSLMDKNILIEYAIYNDNYYGAPKPVGSINNVIVVETQGFKKIKELYGSQAIGVYVDTPNDVIDTRIRKRNDTTEVDIQLRFNEDNKVFDNVKSMVDIVVDGTQPVDISIIQILKYIKERTL